MTLIQRIQIVTFNAGIEFIEFVPGVHFCCSDYLIYLTQGAECKTRHTRMIKTRSQTGLSGVGLPFQQKADDVSNQAICCT